MKTCNLFLPALLLAATASAQVPGSPRNGEAALAGRTLSASMRAAYDVPPPDAPWVDADGLAGPSASYATSAPGRFVFDTRPRPEDVLASQLRRETLQSRRANVYGMLTEEDFPEIIEDDAVERHRSRAARQIIGDSVGAVIASAFLDDPSPRRTFAATEGSAVTTGFDLDATPAWTVKRRSGATTLRVGVPLTPSAFRLRATRDLRGTDRSEHRIGAGLSVDPFDQSIRCGMTFEF